MKDSNRSCRPDWIDAINLFSGLDAESRRELNSLIRWEPYDRGEIVTIRLDEEDSVYLVAKGGVQVAAVTREGKEVVLEAYEEGSIFGKFCESQCGISGSTVVTTSPSVIGTIATDRFSRILDDHPELAVQLVATLAITLNSFCNRFFEYAALNVSQRIVAEITRITERASRGSNSVVISRMPTDEEIAKKVSTHREAVTKEIGRLKRIGLLDKRGRKLIVPSISRLKSAISVAIPSMA